MKEKSDKQLSWIFFTIACVCALIGMILSPLEQEALSITFSMIAVVIALGGIFLAFESLKHSQNQ